MITIGELINQLKHFQDFLGSDYKVGFGFPLDDGGYEYFNVDSWFYATDPEGLPLVGVLDFPDEEYEMQLHKEKLHLRVVKDETP
jgi:hypothetical protein